MKTEKDKMLSGELYDSSDNELSGERELAADLIREYNNTAKNEYILRQEILEKLLNVQGRITIEPPFFCDYGYNIETGDNFYANYNCIILDVCKVKIGDNVLLAPGVHIYTASHPTDPAERLNGKEYGKEVIIGSNVWIGGGAIICPGVKIGSNTTIGAGSVVTADIPENVIAAGNPCRIIRNASEERGQ